MSGHSDGITDHKSMELGEKKLAHGTGTESESQITVGAKSLTHTM